MLGSVVQSERQSLLMRKLFGAILELHCVHFVETPVHSKQFPPQAVQILSRTFAKKVDRQVVTQVLSAYKNLSTKQDKHSLLASPEQVLQVASHLSHY